MLEVFSNGGWPIECLVPEGPVAQRIGNLLGLSEFPAGARMRRGDLTLQVIPFVPQEKFDALLWAMDCVIVRGEDSFVRAQWAGRPFLWQIYPQEEEAHLKKLAAFEARYLKGLPPGPAQAFQRLFDDFNQGRFEAEPWRRFLESMPLLRAHALRWRTELSRLPEMTTALVEMCRQPE
jgi:uncharacterized repeat protein (TIGR03837 family)